MTLEKSTHSNESKNKVNDKYKSCILNQGVMDLYTRGDKMLQITIHHYQVYCFTSAQIPAFQTKCTILALILPITCSQTLDHSIRL